MAREGLRLLVDGARERGAEEGRVEAAERARHPLVRRTQTNDSSPRAQAFARAVAEMDDFGFGGDAP